MATTMKDSITNANTNMTPIVLTVIGLGDVDPHDEVMEMSTDCVKPLSIPLRRVSVSAARDRILNAMPDGPVRFHVVCCQCSPRCVWW